ncbi:protein EXPORTIN 1B-like [Humulus lupulus]|uniref:protein EXPORTIN 1B-like n=1 Tax=Humulus lupulus TaxID=3486 RepID=UPI002B40FCDF|nr:protein EXPORTIN 1B-like [Humulus lupulus]
MPSYQNLTLQCLTEVAALNFGDFYNAQYVKMYTIFMKLLQTMIPLNTNIPEAYAIGSSEEQAFIQNLALFFTSIYKASFFLFSLYTFLILVFTTFCYIYISMAILLWL